VFQKVTGRLRIRRLLRQRVPAGAPVPGARPRRRDGGPDEPGGGAAGVREPRRPLPTSGAGAAAVPPE